MKRGLRAMFVVGVLIACPRVAAAGDSKPLDPGVPFPNSSGTLLEGDPSELIPDSEGRPLAPVFSNAAPRDARWTQFEIDSLRQEKRDLQIARPAAAVALSTLGFVAGTWMLAFGVESARGPIENCSIGEQWCFSRPAPYAGTVLIGISLLGLVRAGKRLKQRATRRRQIASRIRELDDRELFQGNQF